MSKLIILIVVILVVLAAYTIGKRHGDIKFYCNAKDSGWVDCVKEMP